MTGREYIGKHLTEFSREILETLVRARHRPKRCKECASRQMCEETGAKSENPLYMACRGERLNDRLAYLYKHERGKNERHD